MDEDTLGAIEGALDSGLRTADGFNVADCISWVSESITKLAFAITPIAAPNQDAAGGTVSSLTEAVMGMTAGLVQIADALHDVASAIREARQEES